MIQELMEQGISLIEFNLNFGNWSLKEILKVSKIIASNIEIENLLIDTVK